MFIPLRNSTHEIGKSEFFVAIFFSLSYYRIFSKATFKFFLARYARESPRHKLSSASPAILGALVKLKSFIGAFIPITLKVGYPAIIAHTALMPRLIKFFVLLKAHCWISTGKEPLAKNWHFSTPSFPYRFKVALRTITAHRAAMTLLKLISLDYCKQSISSLKKSTMYTRLKSSFYNNSLKFNLFTEQ